MLAERRSRSVPARASASTRMSYHSGTRAVDIPVTTGRGGAGHIDDAAHLGVLPLVLSARKSAFSAPRIWTVEAGYLDRFVNEPACEISLAAT